MDRQGFYCNKERTMRDSIKLAGECRRPGPEGVGV